MRTMRVGCAVVFSMVLAIYADGCNRSRLPVPPKENIFRFSLEQKITSVDPHFTRDVYSSMTESLVYEPLYYYHYLKRPFEVVPLLAESMPTFSSDRKKLTIKLKKGVLFHNEACFEGKSRELTADDVLFTFHRIAKPGDISSDYGNFEGLIDGFKEFHQQKASSIKGIKIIDPYTIEFTLLRPQPRLIYKLASIHTAILSKTCTEKWGNEIRTHPVGTGAFLMKQLDLGSRVEAIRNPEYKHLTYPTDGNPGDAENGLLADAGKPLPLIDGVKFDVVVESQPRFLKFLNGETEMSGVPRDSFSEIIPGGKLAADIEARHILKLRQPRCDVTTLYFNMKDPVWGNSKDLRHALSLAIDRNELIRMQWAGEAMPAQSIGDPTQYGYDPSYKSKWTTPNLEESKRLLAKAGYPGGKGLPPIVLPSVSGTVQRQHDEIIARQLARVGIKLQIEQMPWPQFDQRLAQSNYTIVGMGNISSYPDIDDNLAIIHSKNLPPGPNHANYVNQTIDRLVDEIEQMENGPARLAKLAKVRDILDDDMPIVPIAHRIATQLSQPWLKNHVFLESMYLGEFVKFHKIEVLK